MGKRELVALLNLSPWCLMKVEWPFLAVPWVSLQFVIVVFPDYTRLLFLTEKLNLSPSKYQKDILTEDENYHGTQHIKRIFFLY